MLLLLLLACQGSEDTDPSVTDTDSESLTESSDDELDFGTAYPNQYLSGYAVDEDNQPLEGVTVCLVDASTSSCDDSDADGAYVVGPVTEAVDAWFTLQAEGRVPTLVPWRTDGFRGAGAMNFRFHVWPDQPPFSADEQGTVLVTVNAGRDENHHNNVEGVALALDGAQPQYLDRDGAVDASLDRTSARGQAIFSGVSPGEHTAAVDAPGTCTPWYAWGQTSDEASLPVEVGWLTHTSLSCP